MKLDPKLNKKIGVYVKGFVAALLAGKVPAPSGGDCWGCCMKDMNTGFPVMGTGHLHEHFDENYYVPSLFANAIRMFPLSRYSNCILHDIWGTPHELSGLATELFKYQATSSLRRYLRNQLKESK